MIHVLVKTQRSISERKERRIQMLEKRNSNFKEFSIARKNKIPKNERECFITVCKHRETDESTTAKTSSGGGGGGVGGVGDIPRDM